MGIGASKSQGSEATYEKRDVETVSADKSNWPELAGAKLAESNGAGRKPHNCHNFCQATLRKYREANITTKVRDHLMVLLLH